MRWLGRGRRTREQVAAGVRRAPGDQLRSNIVDQQLARRLAPLGEGLDQQRLACAQLLSC
jgi:hypothetical protein